MANGLEGLIRKHAADTEDGSFESLMCQFALKMLDNDRDTREHLEDLNERLDSLEQGWMGFVFRIGAAKATLVIIGILLVNGIAMTGGLLWIMQMCGII